LSARSRTALFSERQSRGVARRGSGFRCGRAATVPPASDAFARPTRSRRRTTGRQGRLRSQSPYECGPLLITSRPARGLGGLAWGLAHGLGRAFPDAVQMATIWPASVIGRRGSARGVQQRRRSVRRVRHALLARAPDLGLARHVGVFPSGSGVGSHGPRAFRRPPNRPTLP
jgi:hypothetical protein